MATTARSRRHNSTPADDEMLTILEMCTLMKISRRTFYRWKAAGDVPDLFPLGGEFRAWRSDYQAWLLNRARRTTVR